MPPARHHHRARGHAAGRTHARSIIFLALLLLCAHVANVKVCNADDYGAVGDGVAYDTSSLQLAIDACASGKGTVTLTKGKTYLTGSLNLTDGSTLEVTEGAQLLASTRREDYGQAQSDWYLLKVQDCQGCVVKGGGVVNGSAAAWVLESWPDRKLMRNWKDPSCATPSQCRPHLVGIINSTKVKVEGVQLVDPVFWCLHILHSSSVVVDGVTILGDWNIPNNDGIDIDGSADVIIRNCKISTADDAICAKTTIPGTETTGLRVSNCELQSKSSAIKIGSESHGNFKDLVFQDIRIKDSHRGLGIQIRDEGNLTGVKFIRIKISTQLYNASWWGAGEPIYITRMFRRPDQKAVGQVDGVVLQDIEAWSENGVVVSGMQGAMLGSVSISNLDLHLVKVSSWPGGYRDFRPGCLGVINATVPAVLAQYVDTLALSGITISMPADPRLSWSTPLKLHSHTVRSAKLDGIQVVDDAVRTAEGEPLEADGAERAGAVWGGHGKHGAGSTQAGEAAGWKQAQGAAVDAARLKGGAGHGMLPDVAWGGEGDDGPRGVVRRLRGGAADGAVQLIA